MVLWLILWRSLTWTEKLNQSRSRSGGCWCQMHEAGVWYNMMVVWGDTGGDADTYVWQHMLLMLTHHPTIWTLAASIVSAVVLSICFIQIWCMQRWWWWWWWWWWWCISLYPDIIPTIKFSYWAVPGSGMLRLPNLSSKLIAIRVWLFSRLHSIKCFQHWMVFSTDDTVLDTDLANREGFLT